MQRQNLAPWRVVAQQVGELIEADGEIALHQPLVGMLLGDRFEDGDRAPDRFERRRAVALPLIAVRQFGQRRRFEPQQLDRRAGAAELALQRLHPLQDVVDQVDRHAGAVAQFAGEVEHQRLGGLARGAQRVDGALALDARHLPLPDRQSAEHEQRAGRRPGERQRAALLAHLLREQVLLRHAVDGGGEVGAEVDEARVARVGAVAIGAEIDPARLGGEFAAQHGGQRRGVGPGEIAPGHDPSRACRRSARSAAFPGSCGRASTRSPCRPTARRPPPARPAGSG